MTVTRRSAITALLGVGVGLGLSPPSGAATVRNGTAGEALHVRTNDGLILSAAAYGNLANPEILFVHGLGQSRLSWDKQIVAGMIDRFRIVTYDLRGHGDSDKPRSSSAYSDGALWGDDLRAVIEQTRLRRPLLVGWSLGGLITGHYLARCGVDGIAGVNLVDAVTSFTPGMLSNASNAFGAQLASRDVSIRSSAIAAFLSHCFLQRPPDAAFDQMLAYNGMVPREVQEGVTSIRTDGLDRAFGLVPRMLLTHGARDALVNVAMSRRMLAINRSAHLSIYPDAGHSPFIEDAVRFNRELAAFADVASRA